LVVPRLLEIERALSHALVEGDDALAARYILADGLASAARLAIHRNNFLVTVTKALRLSFPAVDRLVGTAFFDSAARTFIAEHPPRSAWLDEYGARFPEFLANFAPAASLAYLPGVARLEWAVSRALHAADADPLDLARLAAIDLRQHGRIAFAPHPSVGLVRAEHPVDAIWRSVLAADDAAMAAIDLGAGPVWLIVQRFDTGLDVRRLGGDAEWCFTAALCTGRPLQEAIDAAPEADAAVVLADHLAAGLFVDFALTDREPEVP
jgi:hypothetical protein